MTTSTSTPYATVPGGAKSIEVPFTKAELANSIFGDSAETFFPGLISAPLSVIYRQDFGATGVDFKLWTKWNSEVKFKVKIRPVNATFSSTNPSYIFNRVGLFSITPVSGAHGALLENKAEFRLLSGGSVLRSTTT